MLICSKNLFGQNSDTSPLKGYADSLVAIDIATLREANIKLKERLLFKEIIGQQDTIIINQYNIIESYKQENLSLVASNIDIKKQNAEVERLNTELNRNLKVTKIVAYSLGGVSIATIGYILISSIVHGK